MAISSEQFNGLPAVSTPEWNGSQWGGVPGLPGASGNANPSATVPVIISGQQTGAALPSAIDTGTQFGPSTQDQSGLRIQSDLQGIGNALGIGDGSTTLPSPGATGSSSGTLSDLFLRSVIIILGFIFVAVGLSMFKNNGLGDAIGETLKGKR